MKYETLWTPPLVAAPPSQLDLFVPFTTPELTLAAVRAADTFGHDLNASIRLVKLQIVPFHTTSSPVNQKFVEDQLECIEADLPMRRYAVFTRDPERDLLAMLRPDSVVVLATRRRFWRTGTQALAERIRRHGHRVILVRLKGAKEFDYA
jgi:hypothetical protein